MSEAGSDDVVAPGCTNVRQGDVLDLAAIPLALPTDGLSEPLSTPFGVVVLSQTCDIVQASKSRCLVAPILAANQDTLSSARKGRKPLHLFLGDGLSPEPPRVADLECATSVPKQLLEGRRLLARYTDDPSGPAVIPIAYRIGRAFNRFPFPDDVYPVFAKLRARAQKRAGSASPFGLVIDLLCDLRVSADQWTQPHRRLKVWIVVPQDLIAPIDDLDPAWRWDQSRVEGIRHKEEFAGLDLNRVCELIIANRERDLTTLARLWTAFGLRTREDLLSPLTGDAVASIEVEVLSEIEMTYQQFHATESLDLEALSLTALPIDPNGSV